MKSLSCLLLLCVMLVMNASSVRAQVDGGGTPGQVPVWMGTSTLGDSVITQSPDNNIGIGTTNPLQMLHVAGNNAILRLESSRPDLWTITEYATDAREWHTGVGGSQVPNDVKNKYYIFDANAGQFRMVIDTNGSVGIGTAIPGARLDVNTPSGIAVNGFSGSGPGPAVLATTVGGTALRADAFGSNSLAIWANGIMKLEALYDLPGGEPLCRGQLSRLIGHCPSSLRYKTDVRPFLGGLDIVNRLRPIAFTWKESGMRGVGLAAEEVEKVEPLLTFRNDKGEIEGVRYNELSAVFVNAFTEQQEQIKRQQSQIEALKKLVCLSQPNAEACK